MHVPDAPLAHLTELDAAVEMAETAVAEAEVAAEIAAAVQREYQLFVSNASGIAANSDGAGVGEHGTNGGERHADGNDIDDVGDDDDDDEDSSLQVD